MTAGRLAALGAALVVAACAPAPPQTSAPPSAGVGYVVIGPGGEAIARAIVDSTTCPDLDVDGAPRAMSVRAPAQRLAQRPGQAKPADFLVTVCELALPAGAQRVALAGRALPLPKPAPSRIVVVGDSGCRVYATIQQACNDPAQWPFARVAAAAAATAPDLVIHVGDYHYRESACPPTAPGCTGTPWGYGYDVWDSDFVAPARPLLAAAPWIVVRGNHETCDRAGQGWWRLLDPRPLAPRQDCNDAADDALGDYSEPYAVPIGNGERVVVFDSSNAGNGPIAVDGVAYRTYRAQIQRLFAAQASAPAASAFFAVHHPPLAFAANPARPGAPFPGNLALQATLGAEFGAALFPPSVGGVLSGHNHAFETVSFASGQPPQVVVGNGGTALDAPLPEPFPPGLTPLPGAVVRELRDADRFGFVTLDRASAGWTLTAFDVNGTPMTTCTLGARALACKPIAR